MKNSFEKIIEQCDAALRSGQPDIAIKLLNHIGSSKLPRPSRLPLAKIARRAGMVDFGLRLLTEIARDDDKTFLPTSAELAEYAVLLQRTGATKEAIRILSALNSVELPDVNLYLAFCYFDLWEHARAIPHLEAYIQAAPSSYMQLVGRVNLAAALVADLQYEKAAPFLIENIQLAEKEGHTRLLGNCLEMLGQIHVLTHQYGRAEEVLGRAQSVLGSSRSHDELFVKKWLAVLEAFKTSSTDKLKSFKLESLARGEPEGARDADLYSLAVAFSYQEFEHLYFGSAPQSYRKKIEILLGQKPTSTHYVYGTIGGNCLDLQNGSFLTGDTKLVEGSKIHQLLEILLRDFYRPMSTGEIFADLFPGERFDIFTSPHRVRQVEYRLRTWIDEQEIPVKVLSRDRFCSLSFDGPFSFRVPLERLPVDRYRHRLTLLRQVFHRGKSFSAADACAAIQLSSREFQIFARRAVDSGDLEKFGAARNTIYNVA
jgi:tetratricopeptide (TPR) repeat protein